MAIRQEANTPLLITIGGVSGFLLLVLIIGIQAWFLREVQREVRIKYENTPIEPVTSMRDEQLSRIATYGWADQKNNRVTIPIDQAMKLIVQNHGQLPTTQP